MALGQPVGVLLVGSVPFHSAEDVLTKCSHVLGTRLLAIPDGETGERDYFVDWQKFVFPSRIWTPRLREGRPLSSSFRCTLEDIKPTKYDEAAIASYQKFCDLRTDGKIPDGVRFQVSIPTPVNACWASVDTAFRKAVQPLYKKRLLEDLQHLQDTVPANDLAIQIDCAIEFAYLESERGRIPDELFKPYSSLSLKDELVDGIVEVSAAVNHDVLLGYHFCYGDIFHQHFVQPEDLGLTVDVAARVLERVTPRRPVAWVHFPVPKDRKDVKYFEPMKELHTGETKIFLGLVHANDEEGTVERIEAAQKVCPITFGLATECGLGRTAVEEVDSILEILKKLAAERPSSGL
ncbi:MAG: hypothetical protein M1820_010300 [Bogoriella megaspora]|nr:MAG: hypothetical protein M1820_010300 [Bogoriella megaspora]